MKNFLHLNFYNTKTFSSQGTGFKSFVISNSIKSEWSDIDQDLVQDGYTQINGFFLFEVDQPLLGQDLVQDGFICLHMWGLEYVLFIKSFQNNNAGGCCYEELIYIMNFHFQPNQRGSNFRPIVVWNQNFGRVRNFMLEGSKWSHFFPFIILHSSNLRHFCFEKFF